MEIDGSQLTEWKHSQGTEYFIKTIEVEIENIRDDWSNLSFDTEKSNDRAIGRVTALLDILKGIEDIGVEE